MWQLKSNDLSNERLLLEESLFSIGNGYIGARGCFEEAPDFVQKTIRGSYINGYYDRVPILYGESAFGFPTVQDKQPRIMDTQTSLIFLDGEPVIFEQERIKDYYRVFDFKKGFLERGYIYITKNGKEAKIIFRRLASFEAKNLLSYEIKVTYKGNIEICSLLDSDVRNHAEANDPRVASGHSRLLELEKLYVEDELSYCEMRTITTQIPILAVVGYRVSSENNNYEIVYSTEPLKISANVKGENHLTLQKNCVFTDGIRANELYEEALKIHKKYAGFSFDDIVKTQEAFLNTYWENTDIEIYGSEKIQEAIRFQLFHLLQSVGKDEISNISAKGLSGEGYEGHYFWDTEIYVLPLFQFTQPQIAKQLLSYRYHILPEAKKRALELGHKKGAAYPWRTISGIECSSYFPAGTAQYHINADIAYGFIQYYLYNQDNQFMLEKGAEVVFETARIWLEIGHWHKDEYHIVNVTGPDEYTAVVNNNFYTNAMAKYHMNWADKLYNVLMEYDAARFNELCQKLGITAEEINEMKLASEAIYLPKDEELGIHAQDDTFLRKAIWDFENTKEDQYPLLLNFHPLTIYRYQVLKQADTVLAHFLLEDYADLETMKKSFNYYEKITTHDSSLSSCIYGIMASKCGYNQKAYEYFMESVRLDLDNKHGNTKDGLHMANLAGSCLAIINGFAGFRIKPGGISIAPTVPEELQGYRFRVQYLNSVLEIKVSEKINIKLIKGNPAKIKVYGSEYLIEDESTLERM